MKLNQIAPKLTDRAVFIGQTGCGKSTLARELLRTRFRVWAIDVNGLLEWGAPDSKYSEGEYLVVNSIAELLEKQEYPKILFQPSIDDADNFLVFDQFFHSAYLAGGVTVYVDEAYAVTNKQVIPRYYKACLTRGRVRDIETWTSTQRPSGIPSFILSESENTYLFKLKYPADLKRAEQMTGINDEYIRNLPKRHFCYIDGDGGVSYKLKLNLGE
jgi:hypothetical protein